MSSCIKWYWALRNRGNVSQVEVGKDEEEIWIDLDVPSVVSVARLTVSITSTREEQS